MTTGTAANYNRTTIVSDRKSDKGFFRVHKARKRLIVSAAKGMANIVHGICNKDDIHNAVKLPALGSIKMRSALMAALKAPMVGEKGSTIITDIASGTNSGKVRRAD